MKLHVVIPTIGRADLVRQTIGRLWAQDRPPDELIVAATSPSDIEGLAEDFPETRVIFAPRGSCSQRNRALDHARREADVVLFFDDDFLAASDYLRHVERMFERNSDIVGACGRIIADGVRGPGIPFDQALSLVEEDQRTVPRTETYHDMEALYGCNMAVRVSAMTDLAFDENLPLYGWLEDIDFSYQLGRKGRLVKASAPAGVHLGSRGARSPGRRLGYSQIANPIYLLRKGGIPTAMAWKMMTRNLASNALHTIHPQAEVDHRGRFAGNLEAVRDVVKGRVDPRRILEFE